MTATGIGGSAGAEALKLAHGGGLLLARQVMEQGHVGRNEVPLGRKMPTSQVVEEPEGCLIQSKGQNKRRGVPVHRLEYAEAAN